MKVERNNKHASPVLTYDQLLVGHLYIDIDDEGDTDIYLATDEGVASLDTGHHYQADVDLEFPDKAHFIEVGGKAVVDA